MKAERIKPKGQSLRQWLEELVQSNPEAQAAYEDEHRKFLELCQEPSPPEPQPKP